MKKFLETGDAGFINADVEKGIPVKNGYSEAVDHIIEKFNN